MRDESHWLATYSPLLVACFTIAATGYAVLLYVPCWRAGHGTSDPTRSWSAASPALIYHAFAISMLVVVALCFAAPVLQSAINIFASTFFIPTAKWWTWSLGFIGLAIAGVVLEAVTYAQGVTKFLEVAHGYDTPPYFFWYRELLAFLAPICGFSAALSIDFRQRHFQHALESLAVSSLGTFFVFFPFSRSLHYALAPTVLAASYVFLFLHFRQVGPSPFRFPRWLVSRWQADA